MAFSELRFVFLILFHVRLRARTKFRRFVVAVLIVHVHELRALANELQRNPALLARTVLC